MLDLKTYLDNAVNAARQERLKQSDQLTLGELILKIEACQNADAQVKYDFEYLFPTDIDSWRGSYYELALNWETYSYKEDPKPMKVAEFLKMLKECIGKTFTGYKGGEYVMGKTTPIWVANYGNSGNTAVIEVVDNDYEVILITGYREY